MSIVDLSDLLPAGPSKKAKPAGKPKSGVRPIGAILDDLLPNEPTEPVPVARIIMFAHYECQCGVQFDGPQYGTPEMLEFRASHGRRLVPRVKCAGTPLPPRTKVEWTNVHLTVCPQCAQSILDAQAETDAKCIDPEQGPVDDNLNGIVVPFFTSLYSHFKGATQ